MKQFIKKILTASVLIALGSASNAWADSGSTAISGSTAVSNAMVAVTTNNPAETTATNAAASNGSTASDNSQANSSGNGSATANGSGIALTDNRNSSDNSQANSSGNGSSTANGNGISITDNSNRSDNSMLTVNGDGSIAARNSNVNSTYKANNQVLDGAVTGNPSVFPTSVTVLASIPRDNNIDHSIVGNAGITQTVQNSGSGLVQQSVLVDGTVNVTQGTAAVTIH